MWSIHVPVSELIAHGGTLWVPREDPANDQVERRALTPYSEADRQRRSNGGTPP